MPSLFPSIPDSELPHTQHDVGAKCQHCDCEHFEADARWCEKCGECSNCSAGMALEDSYEVDGHTYCPECVWHCEECGETTSNEESIHVAHTNSYVSTRVPVPTQCLCGDCSFKCDDCGKWFANSITHHENASENRVCERCAEDYSICESCSCVLHGDDTYYRDEDGPYCSSCYGERGTQSNEDSGILSHSHKPSPHFYASPGEKGELFLGWELEIDMEDDDDDKAESVEIVTERKELYAKEDGSLDNGFEIVSHPGTWKFWQAYNWDFCGELVKRDYRSFDTSTCGMHVHVNKTFLSDTDRYKLLLFFRTNKRLIERLSRRQLHNLATWARIDTDHRPNLLRKAKACRNKTPKQTMQSYEERRAAINFLPIHTVEFRLFRGTLKPQSIKRNLALVTMLCHFVKQSSSSMTELAFLAFVRKAGTGIIGEPEATDLAQWVSDACKDECPSDLQH